MFSILIKRLGTGFITLLLVMVITFGLLHLTPGDPAQVAAGPDADEATVEATRERLGLNVPITVQFMRWMGQLFTGDLGSSYVQRRPVLDMIFERIDVTASLVVIALVFALIVSVPFGIFAATRKDRLGDKVATLWASTGIALPDFFIGVLLVVGVSINLGWLPASGYRALTDDPSRWFIHLILPGITLGTTVAAELTRHIRASLTDVLELDYIRTATAKGIGRRSVVFKHALRNASLPVVTVFGNQITRLLGGTVIVEQVFNLPGIGQLLVQSVFQRDLPVILGLGVFVAFTVIIVNMLVDLSYGWLNPKVRG